MGKCEHEKNKVGVVVSVINVMYNRDSFSGSRQEKRIRQGVRQRYVYTHARTYVHTNIQ